MTDEVNTHDGYKSLWVEDLVEAQRLSHKRRLVPSAGCPRVAQ